MVKQNLRVGKKKKVLKERTLFLFCVFLGDPDYVVDAIDNINTKIDLIKYCYDKNLPVISSMGAGAKADPSRIQIADISETFGRQFRAKFILVCIANFIFRGSSCSICSSKAQEVRYPKGYSCSIFHRKTTSC